MSESGPYGRAANAYWKKSWSPFPVKGKNEMIPTGVTGQDGKDPGWDKIQDWVTRRPFSNVAVRANGWISIDVDLGGEQALLRAQDPDYPGNLGPLPDTWTSTSWGPVSDRRQHFYRIPVGFDARLAEGRFVKTFGPGVDIIHRGHRYAVVAPSVHPVNGQAYAWYRPDGEPAGTILPVRTDLPELPQGWLDFLAHRPDGTSKALEQLGDDLEDVDGFMDLATNDHGWTAVAAQAEVDRMLERIRTVDANINTQAGGAMREVGRFVPALLTMDEAVGLCIDALAANPWHSDGWNAANGKDWTAATLAAMSVARGAEEGRDIIPDGAEPEAQSEDERYTDAFMSERLVREALAGRYIYTTALGWLAWDGARWAEVVDEVVHEAARVWTKLGYLGAVDGWRTAMRDAPDSVKPFSEDPDIRGWAGLQGHGRITSVVKLSRGISQVFRDAADFDQDAHLLNCPNGVVDLSTGALLPHDPARLITKITGVPYLPGAESPALKAALGALPDDVPEWLQLMLGEALTGRSGEQMVLLTGGGRNGKTLLMSSVYRAMGGYAAKVPNTLLLRSKQAGAATPERMTLRGIRLAYMEETPEDGYLDANVVKDLLDAEVVDGRQLYKASTSWVPTHSIFLNTNHPPTITDTGDGTWRRMARVDFPYRYRKAGDALEGPQDRAGDPGLKAALGRRAEGQTALLAWLVAGAVRLYAAGSMEEAGQPPVSVTASVRKWRADSDDILRFVDEAMEFHQESWVSGADLYREFAAWQRSTGQKQLSLKAFTARMEGHTGMPRYVGKIYWLRGRDGLSRPGLLRDGYVEPLPQRVKGWEGLRFRVEQSAFELEE